MRSYFTTQSEDCVANIGMCYKTTTQQNETKNYCLHLMPSYCLFFSVDIQSFLRDLNAFKRTKLNIHKKESKHKMQNIYKFFKN